MQLIVTPATAHLLWEFIQGSGIIWVEHGVGLHLNPQQDFNTCVWALDRISRCGIGL